LRENRTGFQAVISTRHEHCIIDRERGRTEAGSCAGVALDKRGDPAEGQAFAFRCRHRTASCHIRSPERSGSCCALPEEETNTKKEKQGAKSRVMRPKKIILCVNGNEQELSILKFTLKTNGYKVVTAATSQEAIGAIGSMQIDLVLAELNLPQMSGDQLVQRLKKIAAHVPMILLGDPQPAGGEIHVADAMLAKKNCTSMELLERIKTMSARKRGPRKGALRAGQAQAQAQELAAAS
jgi:two-component system, OmpR family, response regulator CpxR